MDVEFRFHLEAYAADLVSKGLPPHEALRRASLEFGGLEMQKEECRASLGLRLWDESRADLRYGWRMLSQSPAFAAVAILSLSLGIGANTAIFSITERILLQKLTVRHPEELRLLSWVAPPDPIVIHNVWGDYVPTPSRGHTSTSFSYPVFLQLLRQNTVFQDLFAFKDVSRLTASIDGHAELVSGQMVSGAYYRDLGVQPIAGRAILPSDDALSSAPVAVISEDFWKRRFGQSPQTVGRTIYVNGAAITIVGVNPPNFHGTHMGSSPDLFFPISLQPRTVLHPGVRSLLESKDEFWVQVMGRLKPDLAEDQADAALAVAFSQALNDTLAAKKGEGIPRLKLLPGERGYDTLSNTFSKPISVLMSMAGLVLLLACVNLANVLLARATARQREIAIRAALGAGRGRIVRQVLTESMLLAVIGGIAGILLGYVARDLIPVLTHSPWEQGQVQADFDLRVVVFALALTLFTGLLFGLAPAWHASRERLNLGLKDASRSSAGLRRAIVGKGLVTFQVLLSLLLLIGAGLFFRTLTNLRSTAIGFEPRHILLFSLEPPRQRYSGARRVRFFHDVEQALAATSGISDVTLSSDALVANNTSTENFNPDGIPKRRGQADHAWVNSVGTHFFQTMGIPILLGRSFDERDTSGSQPVAVINDLLAKEFFPNLNPIGRSFNSDHVTIIGVCANSKFADLRSDAPATFYRPYLQQDDIWSMTYEVKAFGNPQSLITSVTNAVKNIDKDVPLIETRTQTEQIDATLTEERLFAALTGSFGLLALLLASIGIYGVTTYAVAQRTREIGIRMALGAQRPQVLRSILSEAGSLAVLGITGGVIIGLALTRFIASLLYGLKPTDPLTLSAAALLLFTVTLFAAWLPARRASRIDPIQTLRHE